MRPLPVDFVAGRAKNKLLVRLEHEWRDAFLHVGLCNRPQQRVAEEAPGKKAIPADRQLQLRNDLPYLLYPVIVPDEDASCLTGVLRNVGISRQDNPLFLDRFSNEVRVLYSLEIKRIEAEDSQPPRQLRQVVIGNEKGTDFLVPLIGLRELIGVAHSLSMSDGGTLRLGQSG